MHANGEPWVIFEIDGRKLSEQYMRPDDYDFPDLWEPEHPNENWSHQTWQTSLKVSCQIAYLADIPPAAIKVHPYKKPNQPDTKADTQKQFLDSHTVQQIAEHFGITPAAAAKAKSQGKVTARAKAAELTEHPDYYMTEGCGIFAVDYARKNGGEIFVMAADRGESWSDEIPYEVTHAFVKNNGKTFDIRGERTPDKMAWELSMGDYTIKGPWTPEAFEAKFMGSSDDKPLFGSTTAAATPDLQTFYHGTTWEAAAKIDKTGIKANKWKFGPGKFVWVAIHPGQAYEYGQSISWHELDQPERSAVVEFDWPYDKSEPDPEHEPHGDMFRRIPSDIPRSAVRRIEWFEKGKIVKTANLKKTADQIIDVGEGDEYWAGEGNAASGILPVCPQKGTVCLAWRSQYVMGPDCWGTIGGAVQKGKSPQQSAKAELAEEMGYTGGVTLIPAFVFTDRAFSYHNFIGVVSSEFKMAPKPYTDDQLIYLQENGAPDHQFNPGWETDHINWVPYEQAVKDMQDNPEDYHPGMLKLFANSKDAIERALKIEPKPEGEVQNKKADKNCPSGKKKFFDEVLAIGPQKHWDKG